MRLVLVLALGFVVGCSGMYGQRPFEKPSAPAPQSRGETFAERIAPALRATVHISSRTKEGMGLSRGSGVVIDNRMVLTAKHIVDQTGAFDFVVRQGKDLAVGKCIARGRGDDDWAVIMLDRHIGSAIAMIPNGYKLELYGECLVVGHAAGLPTVTVTTGRIQEILPRQLRISAPIWYGNSGGGMYVEVNGELRLAGLTVAMFGPTAHMGLVCHVDAIRNK
jgi:S1-C subfamily serine protease